MAKTRVEITLLIVILSIILLLAISVAGIIPIDGNAIDKNAAVQSLYCTFLPQMCTWMGAVIAFDFGKENFEAANKSVQTIVQKFITSGDKLKSIILSGCICNGGVIGNQTGFRVDYK